VTQPQSTNLDADSATAAAARMVVFAEEVAAVWDEVRPQIQALNEAKPWSDDGTGRDFEQVYLPGAETASGAAGALMSRLVDSGTHIGVAAVSTESADEESGTIMGGAV
jgi:hypothetical protein